MKSGDKLWYMIRGKIKTPILNTKEACLYLGISRATLARYMKSGDIPYIKLAGAVRFYESDILKFLDSKRISIKDSPSALVAPSTV
jgi:excisionase family DNA binding protein